MMKWVLWGAAALLMTHYVKMCWRESMESPFLQLYRWPDADVFAAMRKTTFFGTLPGFLLVSAGLGVSAFAWWGLLLIPIAGIGVVYASMHLVTFTK